MTAAMAGRDPREDDECYCGDRRSEHTMDGRGPCKFNKPHGVGHHGAGDCSRFTPVAKSAVVVKRGDQP